MRERVRRRGGRATTWPGIAAFLGLAVLLTPVPPGAAGIDADAFAAGVSGAQDPDPGATYWIFVGSESSDLLHLVRFGPGGAEVRQNLPVAALYEQSSVPELFTEHEAPHGLGVGPRGQAVYMTTGHGLPDGKLWKVEPGTGRLLADPVSLGRFPASLDVSPDGSHVYVANFNLHGEMAPSSISVVHTGEMVEVARVETCTMPHGSRVHPDGLRHYSVCMMDDQLVEIDAVTLGVSRRLFLGSGAERALDAGDRGFHVPEEQEASAHYEATCSPTWVQPAPEGDRLWVACNRSDQVLEVEFEGWGVTRRFDTGRGPYNLDVTPDGRMLVVTLKQGGAVEFIDLTSGGSVARVPTSTRVAHGVALSPDSRYAFISVEGIGGEPGRVDIFDLAGFERVATVEVALQASGIAFWKMEED